MRIPDNAENLYRTHFPYAIKRLKNGKYFVFNREYQPIGQVKKVVQSVHIDDDIPEEFCINIDISPEVTHILRIPHPNESIIYLYNDATNPIHGGQSLIQYMDKLRILISLKAW